MLDALTDNLALMLTGSTMAILGGLIYSTAGNAFVCRGKFRNKFEALVIFLLSIPILGVATVLVQRFWEFVVPLISQYDLIGLVLILGMLGVNSTVKKWRYFDVKSLIVYAAGIILIIFL